jgi:hypothetical protein
MTYRQAQIVTEKATWLLKIDGVESISPCRNPTGKKFNNVPIEWIVEISCSKKLARSTKDSVEKKLPGVVINWNHEENFLDKKI